MLRILISYTYHSGVIVYRKTQQDIFNATGAMFMSVVEMGVKNTFAVMPVISVERTVFCRERAAGMYSTMAYALAQVTSKTQLYNSKFFDFPRTI